MLSETLKQFTLPAHQELEKKMIVEMRGMRSLDDYARLLQLFYSYFGGLERLVDSLVDEKVLPDYPARRKTAAIAADLHILNATIPAISDHLPEITNPAEALGALYVMEGSTLGGQHIKKIVAKQLDIEGDCATSFFGGYGENTASMWESFKQALDNYSSPAYDPLIIESANQTFQTFSRLFDIHYQNNS